MDLKKIHVALQSADEEIRRSALHLLQDISGSDAQLILFTAMGDDSWRVRKEAVELYINSKPGLNSIEQLLNLLRNEENAGLRNSAAEAAIRLGSLSVLPLIKLVRDSDDDVRKSVIDIMGAIGDPVFMPCLLQTLNDPEVNVASAAAEQLGALGDVAAAEHLIAAVLERDDVLFRFSALGALGHLAHTIPVPEALMQLADQDILKKAVFDCLGAVADGCSFTRLLNGLSCRQKNSRIAAVKALYKVYGRSSLACQATISEALQLLREHDSINGLLELFDPQDAVLTDALIWIGVMTRDLRFIPLLLEANCGEHSDTHNALSALKSFGSEALQTIIPRYSLLDENGRSGLCILIAECGFVGFNDLICEALRDPSPQVQKAAAMAAGTLGISTLIPELIQLLDDGDAGLFSAVIASLQSLALINQDAVMAEVNKLCSSPDPHHRKAAVLLLTSFGERDRLLLLMKDEDSQVRTAAVLAIGSIPVDTSAATLLLALTDECADVRIAAADALGSIQDITTVATLERALNDEDVWVQSAVLKAIARIEPTRAISLIKKFHSSSEGLFLITCLQVLEDVAGAEAEEIIRHALKHSDQDIARQAAKSLAHRIDTPH